MKRAGIDAWRCERGHVHLHESAACAECGGAVRCARISSRARLIAVTTVRVNPTGNPFRLGMAVTRDGRARTLCIVEGDVRGSGCDAVRLELDGERIVARPWRGSRARAVRARSRG